MSKLYKNLTYNFVGQFYLSILSIIMAPIYVKYFGLDSYGLIGFFTVIQSWMQLFDMGFSATLTRQSAQYCNGAITIIDYLSYFKAVKVLFSCFGVVFIIISVVIGYYFSKYWIKADNLSLFEIKICTILIFMISIIRWQQGFYRGVINGFEHQDWLNKFNIIFATIKYIGVLLALNLIHFKICDFFYYQAFVVVTEFIYLVKYVLKILPKTKEKINCELSYIRKNISFSLSIAFTSSIWVLVTQLDKLILSKYLTMHDYACFTLSVAVASGINVLITPISVAILPRFSGLVAKDNIRNFIDLYRKTTRFLVLLITPIVVIFVFQGKNILLAWTNNLTIAIEGNLILRYYALGNGILSVVAMAYYLQFAYGKLRLHIIGNLIAIFFQVPLLIFFTTRFGALGASYVWVISNLFYLIFWIPKVHQTYLKYPHYDWLFKDVIQVCLFSGVVSWFLMKMMMISSERILIFFQSSCVVIISILLSTLVYFPELRELFFKRSLKKFLRES